MNFNDQHRRGPMVGMLTVLRLFGSNFYVSGTIGPILNQMIPLSWGILRFSMSSIGPLHVELSRKQKWDAFLTPLLISTRQIYNFYVKQAKIGKKTSHKSDIFYPLLSRVSGPDKKNMFFMIMDNNKGERKYNTLHFLSVWQDTKMFKNIVFSRFLTVVFEQKIIFLLHLKKKVKLTLSDLMPLLLRSI